MNRSRRPRLRLTAADRLLWAWLSRTWSGWRPALVLVKPDTVLAWHRHGFRLFWTWKSRQGVGRPAVTPEIRTLIRQMAAANPLWGAPRIHGELLKLGCSVSQSTVAKYMPRRHGRPSRPWRSFLVNHASQTMAADFLVVPTLTYRLLLVFVILAHDRRRIVHLAVTDHPTAAWTAQQLRNAFPNDQAPRYLLKDRDAAFTDVAATIAAMQIEEVVTAPRSPWQNAYVERFVWLDSTRMPRSCHRTEPRRTPARAREHDCEDAPESRQGRSDLTTRIAVLNGTGHRNSPGERAAPPLRARRGIAGGSRVSVRALLPAERQ